MDVRIDSGATVTLEGEKLTVRFLRVVEDGRCPVGDPCPSPGDAVLEFSLHQPPHAAETVTLHTLPEKGAAAMYRGLQVRVVALEPRPVGEQPVPLQRYTVTVSVVRLQSPDSLNVK